MNRQGRLTRTREWLQDFFSFVFVAMIICGSIVVVIGGILVGVNHSDHVTCLRAHEQTGLETRYARSGPDGECYIKVNDRWVPLERWINVGSE